MYNCDYTMCICACIIQDCVIYAFSLLLVAVNCVVLTTTYCYLVF